MKRGISFLFIIFTCLIIRPNIATAESTPPVIFSEIAWAGSSVSSADEWIELRNTSEQDININGWQITSLNSAKQEEIMLTLNGAISANSYFLISNNSAEYMFSNGQSVLNVKPEYINTQVSLSNEHFQLKLYNGIYGSSELIDSAGNGNVPPAGGVNFHQSMSRIIPVAIGSQASSWYSSNQRSNLDLQATDFSTPQGANKAQPYLNGSCARSLIPKQKLSQVDCSGEIYDYNGEAVTGSINNQGLNSQLSGAANKWQWQGNINPGINDKIILIITAQNSSGLSKELSLNIQSYSYSNKVIINEVYPSPSSSSNDEWIELFNEGTESVDLYLWQLDDTIGSGSKAYIFPPGSIIEPNNYLAIDKLHSKISFNNSGDEANLIDPENTIINSTSYNNIDNDYSFARLNDRSFGKTSITTKGRANLFPENIDYYASVRISEVLPDPSGRDEEGEWVEIQSRVDYPIDLYNWQIDDEIGGSSPYKIPDHTILDPYGYLSFNRVISNIAFNNDKDSVYIYLPDGSVVDYISYTAVDMNLSYSFFEDGYVWTNNLTKDYPNAKPTLTNNPPVAEIIQLEPVSQRVDTKDSPIIRSANNIPQKITLISIIEQLDIPDLVNSNNQILGAFVANKSIPKLNWLFIYILSAIIMTILRQNYFIWKSFKPSDKPKNSPKNWHPG